MSQLATTSTAANGAALARQIKDQFDAAQDGMLQFIALGAYGLQLREITGGVSACGHSSKTKGTGIKGWLEQHDLGYTRQTLYRAMEIADGLKAEFKIGAKVDLARVLKGGKLDAKEQALRARLADFVAGKSQRQILLGIGKPDAEVGGKRTKKQEISDEEKRAAWLEEATTRAKSLCDDLHDVGERWQLLDDDQLQVAQKAAEDLAKRIKRWLDTPPPSRAEFNLEKYIAAQEAAEKKQEAKA